MIFSPPAKDNRQASGIKFRICIWRTTKNALSLNGICRVYEFIGENDADENMTLFNK